MISENKRRVFITGIGMIGPLGENTKIFWQNCFNSFNVATPIPSHWNDYADYESGIWAPLPSINLATYGITRLDQIQLDICEQLAIASSLQALTDTGLSIKSSGAKKNTYTLSEINASRTGVIIGTGAGGITSLISAQASHFFSNQKSEIDRPIHRFNPFVASMMMPNACSSAVGARFCLTGLNRTVCSACSSGTTALGYAFKAIQQGIIDCALSGATEYLGDQFGGIFRSFDSAKTLLKGNDNSSNCPFDMKRNGFLFSEGGAAVLFLEEASHALSRNAPVIAEIIGFAERFDPYGSMTLEPQGHLIEEMLYEALDDAKVNSSEIDYINAHGTGTIVNDEVESMIIEKIFGNKVLVNSSKSLTGHTIGACGAIEAAITALSLNRSKIHPCLNLINPIRPLNFPRKTVSLPIKFALSESFAFGGHNSVLVFKRYTKEENNE